MGMSKKDFNAMGIQLGMIYRNLQRNMDGEYRETALLYLDMAHDAFVVTAKKSNPQFDAERFMAFVDEVAKGARDNMGRLVKR